MRDLVINQLVEQPAPLSKFEKDTMRWRSIYVTKDQGLIRINTKKEKRDYQNLNPIHISGMTREDWEALPDNVLLWSYMMVIFISSRQM